MGWNHQFGIRGFHDRQYLWNNHKHFRVNESQFVKVSRPIGYGQHSNEKSKTAGEYTNNCEGLPILNLKFTRIPTRNEQFP